MKMIFFLKVTQGRHQNKYVVLFVWKDKKYLGLDIRETMKLSIEELNNC